MCHFIIQPISSDSFLIVLSNFHYFSKTWRVRPGTFLTPEFTPLHCSSYKQGNKIFLLSKVRHFNIQPIPYCNFLILIPNAQYFSKTRRVEPGAFMAPELTPLIFSGARQDRQPSNTNNFVTSNIWILKPHNLVVVVRKNCY